MPDVLRQLPLAALVWLFVLFQVAPFSAAGQPNAAGEPGSGMPLTLSDALAEALQHNPELAGYSEEIRAREAESLQAGLRPNPILSLEAENVLGSGDFSGTRAAETTVSLSQTIELGDKRSRRRELAAAEAAVAQSEYTVAKADVLARTTERFIAVVGAQERLQLAEELAALAGQVLGTVEERIAAGKTPALESLRARMEWRERDVAREKARRELLSARRALAVSMGREADEFGLAAGDLSRLPDLPELSDLERMAEASPPMARRIAERERRRRDVAFESAKRVPDLEVGLGARYLRESDDTAVVAGISIPLPLFDRNQGAIAAARSRLAQARLEERSALLQAKAALAAAWQETAAASEEAEVLGKEIVPAAREGLEAVEYGYRAGKLGSGEVLDAQRTLLDARARHLDALVACHRAAVELNRIVGAVPGNIPAPAAAAAN